MDFHLIFQLVVSTTFYKAALRSGVYRIYTYSPISII